MLPAEEEEEENGDPRYLLKHVIMEMSWCLQRFDTDDNLLDYATSKTRNFPIFCCEKYSIGTKMG